MKRAYGFTIVELLIVIVVVGILAAISIVAYNGVSNQANDAAVRSDLANIGKALEISKLETGQIASNVITHLRSSGIKPSAGSYSEGFINSGAGNNLAVCNTADGANFAVIGWSKSGKGFVYREGGVKEHPYPPATYTTTCPQAGITVGGIAWLYAYGSWRI